MLYCSEPFKQVGPTKEGTPAIIEFQITNQDDKAYVLKPWSSCGCSTPILPKADIAPNETITIRVEFDTMGKVGISEKSVGVFYGGQNRLTLKFKAEVVK